MVAVWTMQAEKGQMKMLDHQTLDKLIVASHLIQLTFKEASLCELNLEGHKQAYASLSS
jgi:hypothetical protein